MNIGRQGARLSDAAGPSGAGHLPEAREEPGRDGFDPLSLLDRLLPIYVEVLHGLAAGATWVQLDEPCLVLDLDAAARRRFAGVRELAAGSEGEDPADDLFRRPGRQPDTALRLPVAGLHMDLVRAPGQLDDVLGACPPSASCRLA